MRWIGNLVWLLLGGFWMGVAWWVAGVVMAISIIGLPWARSCFVIGQLCFLPFGHKAIDRKQLTGRDDLGTGVLGLVGNIVWFLLAGLWLAIGHVVAAIACFVTIIGIPFGVAHLKLAACALGAVPN